MTRRSRAGGRAGKGALLVGLLALGLAATAVDVLYRFPSRPNAARGAPVTVTIPPGVGPRRLAAILSEAGLTESPGRFSLWLRLTGGMTGIKAGPFTLPRDLTPEALVSRLSGRTDFKGVRVVIPEGLTLWQIAEILDAAGIASRSAFLSAATDAELARGQGIPGTFEGYLFPDTYYFDAPTPAPETIRVMHRNFREKTAGRPWTDDKATRHEIVTLASIVQAETPHVDEMPAVAGVYRNRLDPARHPSRRLQADPTVAFGCAPHVRPRAPSCATFKGVLGRRQLDDPVNPYNTYRHAGLPPSPISAPGLAALEAAAHPEEVPYLYFVASDKGDGRHVFSTTLEAHNRAVAAWRNRPAAGATSGEE